MTFGCVIEIPICVGAVNWIEGRLSCMIDWAFRPEVDMSEVETVLTVREDEDEHVPERELAEPELELDVLEPEFETGRGLDKRNGGG